MSLFHLDLILFHDQDQLSGSHSNLHPRSSLKDFVYDTDNLRFVVQIDNYLIRVSEFGVHRENMPMGKKRK